MKIMELGKKYFAHPTAVIDDGAEIGEGTKIWHFCHIFSGAKIGKKCVVGQGCSIASTVVVGDGVKIQNGISMYDGVVLEDGVFCGPHMVFTNVFNPRAFIERKSEFMKTVVGKGASIGAGAVVVCGNNIGEYAFIGAGAVVTRDIPAFALAYGNPAQIKGWVDVEGNKLNFDGNGKAVGTNGAEYRLHNGIVSPQQA